MSEMMEIDQQTIAQEQAALPSPERDDGQWFSKEARTEQGQEKLRAEYVAMQIYKALGVNVPETKIQEENGVMRLKTKKARITKERIDILSFPQLLESPKMHESILAHIFLGDDSVASSLRISEDQFLWTNASNSFAMRTQAPNGFRLYPSVSSLAFLAADGGRQYSDKKFIEQTRLGDRSAGVDVNSPQYKPMAKKIAQLDPQFMVDLVRESGLSVENRQDILNWLFTAQQTIVEKLMPVGIEDESGQALLHEVESFYEQKNEKLYVLGRELKTAVDAIEKYILIAPEIDTMLSTQKSGENQTPSQNHSKELGSIDEQITTLQQDTAELGKQSISLDHLYKKAQDCSQMRDTLIDIRQETPMLIGKILGKNARITRLENRVSDIQNSLQLEQIALQKKLFEHIEKSLSHYFSTIPKPEYHGSNVMFPLEAFSPPPSSDHVETLARLMSLIPKMEGQQIPLSVDFKKKLAQAHNLAERCRLKFQEKSQKIQRSLVSHSTPHATKILESGSLKSPLRQFRENPDNVQTNSKHGREHTNRIAHISFAVGADSGYGLDDGRMGGNQKLENSVAFVYTYPSAVEGHSFLESRPTGGMFDELHIFEGGYDSKKGRGNGTNMSIEEAKLVVPIKKLEYWKKTLLTMGKDEQWINDHLRSYPEDIPLGYYLIHWSHELGFPEEKPGVFLATGTKGEWVVGEDPKTLFEWKTLEDLQP